MSSEAQNPAPPQRSRGWYLSVGIALILLGLMALSAPLFTSLALATLLGWVLLAGGVIQGVRAMRSKDHEGGDTMLGLLPAVLSALIGIWMLVNPVRGVVTLTVLLAAFFVAEGLMTMAAAVKLRAVGGWFWMLLSGLCSLALGFITLSALLEAEIWVIGLLLGIDLIISGMGSLMFARNLGRAAKSY